MMRLPAELRPDDVMAIVDSREQRPLDLSPLKTTIGTLAAGDYALAALPGVSAVERKSLPDLLACVGRERKRFDREIMRLLAYPVRALIVESSWQEIEAGRWNSKITSSAALGSLLGWAAMGIPIFMTETHERAGKFVSRLLYITARRRWKELRSLMKETHVLSEAPSAS